MKLEVGQKVFLCLYRHNRSGELRVAAVERIGRKWVYLSGRWKAEVGSRRLDGAGYTSPGEIYLSEAEHHEVAVLGKAWTAFKRQVDSRGWAPPTGVTVEDIDAARKLLRLP